MLPIRIFGPIKCNKICADVATIVVHPRLQSRGDVTKRTAEASVDGRYFFGLGIRITIMSLHSRCDIWICPVEQRICEGSDGDFNSLIRSDIGKDLPILRITDTVIQTVVERVQGSAVDIESTY